MNDPHDGRDDLLSEIAELRRRLEALESRARSPTQRQQPSPVNTAQIGAV